MKKRRVWKLLALVLVLPALVLAGLQWWVSGRLQPAAITRLMEEGRNCHATVGSVSVRMFAFPARVEIRNVVITPRDENLKPATPGETYIKVEQALLEVNLWSLLTGELDVSRALIEGVEMQTVKWAGGGHSLRVLLQKPGEVPQAPPPSALLEDEDEIPDPVTASAGGEAPWHVSELPLTATLREARLRNVSWTIRNLRRQTVQQYKDGNFVVTGMTLDPKNPGAGGSATITAGTRLIIDSQRLKIRTLDFLIGLEGTYQLVDPATGYLNNDLTFDLSVKKGSLINRIPTLVRLNERLAKLKNSTGLGIELPPEATLQSDAILHARLQNRVLRLTQGVFFPFDTYQLRLDPESWLSLADEQHRFTGQLVISGDLSKKAVASLREFLAGKSSALAGVVSKAILDKIVNPAGDIELPFVSQEEIGHPEVSLSEKLLDAIRKAGAEAGKDLLKDALEGGDDINSIIDAVKDLRKKDK